MTQQLPPGPKPPTPNFVDRFFGGVVQAVKKGGLVALDDAAKKGAHWLKTDPTGQEIVRQVAVADQMTKAAAGTPVGLISYAAVTAAEAIKEALDPEKPVVPFKKKTP